MYGILFKIDRELLFYNTVCEYQILFHKKKRNQVIYEINLMQENNN